MATHISGLLQGILYARVPNQEPLHHQVPGKFCVFAFSVNIWTAGCNTQIGLAQVVWSQPPLGVQLNSCQILLPSVTPVPQEYHQHTTAVQGYALAVCICSGALREAYWF